MLARTVTELEAYQKAYDLAMRTFQVSKSFPSEERFSLTDQIRRSSRSVCSNLAEAWAKRSYEAHFLAKLTDADGENLETATWLSFAKDCGYLSAEDYTELLALNREAGTKLGRMIQSYRSFCKPPARPPSTAHRPPSTVH